MKVIYCDLCGSPIKQIKYILICIKCHVDSTIDESENRYSDNYQESKKEICETCKQMIVDIFKLRMEGILKLASDLKTIYQMPVKENKKRKKKKT